MTARTTLLCLLTLAIAASPVVAQAPPTEARLTASDGLVVFGDRYSAGASDKPVVVLFHQGGGSSRGEYASIAPTLQDEGYDVLAFDLRRGGDRFGTPNRTVAAAAGQEFTYCDAYLDVQAALAFAQGHAAGRPIVAWGSSFSAALVVRLAAEHGNALAGALAFSPASGEPMGECNPGRFAEDVQIPLLALRPESEMEIESVAAQLAMFERLGHHTFVARPGVHGSSMLDAERVGADTSRTWSVVLRFLADVTHP